MRVFDFFLSLIAILTLFPLFLFVCLILKCTGEGEIFFFQDRVGLRGRKIKVLKFATMLKDSPNMGAGTITAKNDLRILPVGRFLRKTKINELPQLINILKGDMSFIGPRPHAQRDLQGIDPFILEQILQVKPGLSGIGSIVFRNEENILNKFDNPRPIYDSLIAPYKASLELWYVRNRNIYLYWFLIIFTFYAVIFGGAGLLLKLFKDLPKPSDELENLMKS
jgi:lipopolysaccharide/colanic/teichoic acid biosynthesis glycosyltransferase